MPTWLYYKIFDTGASAHTVLARNRFVSSIDSDHIGRIDISNLRNPTNVAAIAAAIAKNEDLEDTLDSSGADLYASPTTKSPMTNVPAGTGSNQNTPLIVQFGASIAGERKVTGTAPPSYNESVFNLTGTWKWSRSFVSGTGQHRHSTISSGSITFAPVSGKPNTYTGSGSATLTTNATNAHKRHSKSHSVTVKNGTVSGSRVSFSFHRGDGYNWTVSGTFSADGASFSATGKPIGKAGVFPERTFHKQ